MLSALSSIGKLMITQSGEVVVGDAYPDFNWTNTTNTVPTPGITAGWNSIAYGNNTYVIAQWTTTNSLKYSLDNGATWANTDRATTRIRKVVFYNGLFMTVTDNSNSAFRSADGITWTSHALTMAGTQSWRSVAYGSYGGNDIWVAIGNSTNNVISRSTNNGLNWTRDTVNLVSAFNAVDIAYGNNRFVIISPTLNSRISTDGGATWSEMGTVTNATSITYGDGQFVAVGASGIYRLLDGSTTWESFSFPSSTALKIVYGDGIYVVTGGIEGAGNTWVSQNGTEFSAELPALTSKAIQSSTYANNKFVAIVDTGIIEAVPTFNYTWVDTTYATPMADHSKSWSNMAYGNGTYVIVQYGVVNSAMYSTDNGATWTVCPGLSSIRLRHVLFANGVFIITVNASPYGYKSSDGITWTTINMTGSLASSGWRQTAYGNGVWVAVAQQSTRVISRSTDNGDTWTVDLNQLVSLTNPQIAYGDGRFIISHALGFKVSTDDGLTWTDMSSFPRSGYPHIMYGNGQFLATGTGSTVYSLLDGSDTWTEVATLPDVAEIIYGGGLYLAVTGGSIYSPTLTSLNAWVSTTGTSYANKPPLFDTTSLITSIYANGKFTVLVAGSNIMEATWPIV